METIDIALAKARFSQLLSLVERGEEVVLLRRGQPVAKIIRVEGRPAERYPNRGLGIDRGRFEVPDDFDAPLPPEIMRYFT